jgi:hypothetical protein
MSIEKATNKFGIEFPAAYNKIVWINANGHGGDFTVEVSVRTWKDQAAKEAREEPLELGGAVFPMTTENKADLDIIRAAAYRMLHREANFKAGKKV